MEGWTPPFSVTCFSLDCTWRQECAVYEDAVAAGEQHKAEHPGHMTYVFRPAEDQAAA